MNFSSLYSLPYGIAQWKFPGYHADVTTLSSVPATSHFIASAQIYYYCSTWYASIFCIFFKKLFVSTVFSVSYLCHFGLFQVLFNHSNLYFHAFFTRFHINMDAYKKNMACPRCLVCVHYHLISEFFHRKTCRFSKQQAFLVYTSPVIATGALIYSGYGRGIPLCVRFSDW